MRAATPERHRGVSREALKEGGLARADAEVAELDLRLSPTQSGGSVEGGRIPMLIHEFQQTLSRRRDDRPVGDVDDRSGWDSQAVAQSEHRVEHGPHCVRQSPAIKHRDRSSNVVSAAEESSPVGLDLRLPTTSPATTATCATQISGSFGARRRRVAIRASSSARYSVSTKSLEKAGWATSEAWGASTSSARK